MDAKEYLETYAGLKMENLHNEERIAEAYNKTLLPAMKPVDGSKVTSSGGDRQERAYISYIDLCDFLQPQIDTNKAIMRKIELAICGLHDPFEREVLRLRYLDTDGWKPTPWKAVAYTLYRGDDEKDIKACHRLHNKALAALDVILPGLGF